MIGEAQTLLTSIKGKRGKNYHDKIHRKERK